MLPLTTTTRTTMFVLLTFAALLLTSSSTKAQVVPTSSIDPLNGSTFSTPVFTPANTFTPATTYASAGSRTPTTISGPGPSVDPASYSFSYDNPLSTVSGTDLSNLYSSLAANGTPTAATSGLFPDPSNLQIVAATTGASNAAAPFTSPSILKSVVSVALAVGAGVAFVAFV